MTRKFNARIRCEHCGQFTTEESPFERWMRNHPQLESYSGIVRFDLDIFLHRYKLDVVDGRGSRNLQAMMFIEIKTHMAAPSDAQADSLYGLDQLLRNRKPNMHNKPRRQSEPAAPIKIYSKMLKRDIRVMCYGGHLLQIDNTSPDNSLHLMWDKQYAITQNDLVELLRFERDPDDPTRRIDWRRRSKAWKKIPTLFET